jgi:hypothetical protein
MYTSAFCIENATALTVIVVIVFCSVATGVTIVAIGLWQAAFRSYLVAIRSYLVATGQICCN